MHRTDNDEEDENVKQLGDFYSIYISLQDCLVNSDRNWKQCQKEVLALKACNDYRRKNQPDAGKKGKISMAENDDLWFDSFTRTAYSQHPIKLKFMTRISEERRIWPSQYISSSLKLSSPVLPNCKSKNIIFQQSLREVNCLSRT